MPGKHNIWKEISSHPYLVINGLFVALIANNLIDGRASGQTYAFLLLLYLILILGIRLDEINKGLTSIAPGGHIDQRLKRIESTLKELRQEIRNLSAAPPADDLLTVKQHLCQKTERDGRQADHQIQSV